MTWEAAEAGVEVLQNDRAQEREYQAMQEGFEVRIARHQARDDEWLHVHLEDRVWQH